MYDRAQKLSQNLILPIAQLCKNNYLKKQQKIQTQAINLAQTTLVSFQLFIYDRDLSTCFRFIYYYPSSGLPTKVTKIMLNKKHLFSVLGALGMSVLTFVLGFAVASGRSSLPKTLPVSPNLIPLNSTEGEQFLLTSTARQDYLPLSAYFVTQKNPAYCGVASMVMVLNALSIPAPAAPELGNSHAFTQDNVFNDRMRQIRSPTELSFRGMTLYQLGQFLASHSVKVDLHYGSDTTLNEFRRLGIKNLQEPNNFVVVNYLRRSINQQQAGHISPVAAYHQPSDRFLILDVSRYKYPPVWVKAEDLWKATATQDSESGKTRGFVLVSTK